MHHSHPLRESRVDCRFHERLKERAVKGEIGLRNLGNGREHALVFRLMAAKRADVVQGSWIAMHDPIPGYEIGMGRAVGLAFEAGFVKAGRQDVDEVDVAGELAVLFLRDPARNKDAKMPDLLVDGVDDGLPVGPDLIDILVEIENPPERLLRRGDVIALRAEHDDRRADVAQIDRGAIRQFHVASGELVPDEKLVDDHLNFFRIQIDVPAPPALEFEVAGSLRVDLRIEVVLLGPERIGEVQALEILHEPRAIELASAHITC